MSSRLYVGTTTEISVTRLRLHQVSDAGDDVVAKALEQRCIGICRLTHEDVRNPVWRPLLRVEIEIAVLEGDERGAAHRAGNVRRAGIHRHDDARAFEDRGPLVERKAA